MIIDRTAFFIGYRAAFGRLSQAQVVGIETLLGFIEDDPLPDVRWIAYLLATTKHECADTWMPIEERGARTYFNKYEPGTRLGRQLGNTEPGDGYLFRGRGYVQITGRRNYSLLGGLLGDDLVGIPEKACMPLTAYRIACVGMARGLFTGRKLGDHLGASTDYVAARRVVNGTDRADLIASYAEAFARILAAFVQPDRPAAPAPVTHDNDTLAAAVRRAISDLQRAVGDV